MVLIKIPAVECEKPFDRFNRKLSIRVQLLSVGLVGNVILGRNSETKLS